MGLRIVFLIYTFVAIFSGEARAQLHNFLPSIYVQGGVTVPGNSFLKPNYKNGFNAGLMAEYSFGNWVGNIEGGYVKFTGRHFEDEYFITSIPDLSYWPIHVGVGYSVTSFLVLRLSPGLHLSKESRPIAVIKPGLDIRYKRIKTGIECAAWGSNSRSVTVFNFLIGIKCF